MQSCPNDWDETFRYLSREMFAPEPIETQVPTPPASDILSPCPKEGTTLVSVSTTFFPGAGLGQPRPSDMTLHTSDSVFFYVHSTALLKFSKNSFNSLVQPYPISPTSDDGTHTATIVPEDSHVLNIVLHLLYMIPCIDYCPSPEVISKAVSALKRYGVSITPFAAPGTCLYDLILSRAPLHPLELYALVAENDLHDLAVAISPHLMSLNLSTLTDEVVTRIGPTYLKRLFFLHLGRNEALKRLLFTPPRLHGPTPQCDFVEQRKLTRAWALAAAYIVWDIRPDLSIGTLSSVLSSLNQYINCQECQENLKFRVKQIIVEWSNVKRTI